LIESPEENKKR